MSDVCGIYLIKNTMNGKVYVGQSAHINRRWRELKERRLAVLRVVTQACWAKWRVEKEMQCS